MGKWTNFKKEVKEEVKMLWKPVVAGTVVALSQEFPPVAWQVTSGSKKV